MKNLIGAATIGDPFSIVGSGAEGVCVHAERPSATIKAAEVRNMIIPVRVMNDLAIYSRSDIADQARKHALTDASQGQTGSVCIPRYRADARFF